MAAAASAAAAVLVGTPLTSHSHLSPCDDYECLHNMPVKDDYVSQSLRRSFVWSCCVARGWGRATVWQPRYETGKLRASFVMDRELVDSLTEQLHALSLLAKRRLLSKSEHSVLKGWFHVGSSMCKPEHLCPACCLTVHCLQVLLSPKTRAFGPPSMP